MVGELPLSACRYLRTSLKAASPMGEIRPKVDYCMIAAQNPSAPFAEVLGRLTVWGSSST